jgi:DNA-binding PadR family transcriptional regulator
MDSSGGRQKLTPAMFHIMVALAAGEKHGYGVMLEVEELTDGAVRLGPATLYRSIKQLLDAGFIAESSERPDPDLDDERRRYYRLTQLGARAAAREARGLSAVVGAARARGLLPDGAAP